MSSKTRLQHVDREQMFIRYFSLVFYGLKSTQHYIEMAQAFTLSGKVKQHLHTLKSNIDAKLLHMNTLCTRDTWEQFSQDLHGDEVQALGSIMSELVELDNIGNIEDDLINMIRNARMREPGYRRKQLEDAQKLIIEQKAPIHILDTDAFWWRDTPKVWNLRFCSRCLQAVVQEQPIIHAWPEKGEPNFGEDGEYRFCVPCLETIGFKFKNIQTCQSHQH